MGILDGLKSMFKSEPRAFRPSDDPNWPSIQASVQEFFRLHDEVGRYCEVDDEIERIYQDKSKREDFRIYQAYQHPGFSGAYQRMKALHKEMWTFRPFG